jgi:hypothetical protein
MKGELRWRGQIVFLKETGHLWLYYIYMTVFIRNAAKLAHILPKASKIRDGNEN